jgi:integrase
MGFLESSEIPMLLEQLKKSRNKNTYYVAKTALSTGARWSEAESLTDKQISNNRITFTNTKGGENRTIPISQKIADEIPMVKGKLFTSCIW